MFSKEYSLQDVKEKLQNFERDVAPFLEEIENGDNILYDMDDPEQVFLRGNYRVILEKLSDAVYLNKYLKSPIQAVGFLQKNENGRYEVDGCELTSGSTCEILKDNHWYLTRIEHHTDYYAIDFGTNENISGLKARIRKHY